MRDWKAKERYGGGENSGGEGEMELERRRRASRRRWKSGVNERRDE